MESIFNIGNLITIICVIIYQLVWKVFVIDKQKVKLEGRIKAEYAKEIEHLKASNTLQQDQVKHTLDKVLNIELQHKSEERRALTNFIEYYSRWVFKVAKTKIDGLNIINFQQINDIIDNINDDYLVNLTVEKAKILLLVNDELIIKETIYLFNMIGTYKDELIKNLADVYTLFYEQKITEYQYESVDDEGSFIGIEYSTNNISKIQPLKESFRSITLTKVPELFLKIQNFAILSKNYLTSSEFNK